jgi:hypothetical protein
MTITNPEAVKSILANGCEDDGFKFTSIYAYKGESPDPLAGQQQTSFALFSDPQFDDIFQSPYVAGESVVCLATDGTPTLEGEAFIESGELPSYH